MINGKNNETGEDGYFRLLDDLVLLSSGMEQLGKLFALPAGEWVAADYLFGEGYCRNTLNGADFFVCWIEDMADIPKNSRLIAFFDPRSGYSSIIYFNMKTLK